MVRVRRILPALPWAHPLEGKMRHGLFARSLPFENLGERRAYQRLRRELRRELSPNGLVEELYVEQMASALWRKRKALDWARENGGELSERAETAAARLDRQFNAAHAYFLREQDQRTRAVHVKLLEESKRIQRLRLEERRAERISRFGGIP
jgi:hypothetical protein